VDRDLHDPVRLLPILLGGVLVKFSRLFLLVALIGLTATAAMADGIDPTVIIRRVDPPPIAITDPHESFPLMASPAHNVFAFQNDTNTLLYSLSLTLFGFPVALDFNFGENPGADIFSSFAKNVNSDGSTTLLFYGVDETHTGLLPANCFGVVPSNLSTSCQHCVGDVYTLEFDGIPQGAFVFGVGTVATPEPATALLLTTGLAGIAALKKRRKAAKQ
jgi:hypothetical protein